MVALIGASYVTVIAVATVWAEWHRPSDTIAALLVVLAWGGLVSAVLRARPAPGPRRRVERPSRLATLLFLSPARSPRRPAGSAWPPWRCPSASPRTWCPAGSRS